jgi:sulfatase maturation enzyme AslB (radical SAM superfamily)
MMENPCTQCIVKAICRSGCYKLADYIKKEVDAAPGVWNYENISMMVRTGEITLYFNEEKELKWRITAYPYKYPVSNALSK